jgi:hypothetical protein
MRRWCRSVAGTISCFIDAGVMRPPEVFAAMISEASPAAAPGTSRADTVTISQAAQQAALQDAQQATSTSPGTGTDDFTDITPDQLRGVTHTLFQSGKINSQQVDLLNLYSVVANVGPDGRIVPLSASQRAIFDNTPINLIQTIKNELTNIQQSGEAANPQFGYAALQGLLAIFQGKT